jgi:hypothetical protein
MDAPPEERVRKMLVCLVLSGFDRAQRCQKSMDETLAALRLRILQRRFQYNRELADLLVVVLREGVDQGRFDCPSPDASAHTLITSMSGLYPTNLSPEELGGREEIEARANHIVNLVLYGLLARTSRDGPEGASRSKNGLRAMSRKP